MNADRIYQEVFNSVSAHIAILDDTGRIIDTNLSWRKFGQENGFVGKSDCLGMNYLSVCDGAKLYSSEEASRVARGIRDVLEGKSDEYFTEYPCHSPCEKRWYALRVVRFQEDPTRRVIVTHEDITPIMLSQYELEKKEKILFNKGKQLEEANIALKVLLKHREEDKVRLEETFVANIAKLVMPYVEKIKESKLGSREKTLVDILKTHLEEVLSPFMTKIGAVGKLLTPQELHVATLIRQGFSSKEIAEVMQVSVSAIDFHRKNIRKKIGLANTKMNLYSYLTHLN